MYRLFACLSGEYPALVARESHRCSCGYAPCLFDTPVLFSAAVHFFPLLHSYYNKLKETSECEHFLPLPCHEKNVYLEFLIYERWKEPGACLCRVIFQ